jgi:hypothetical protein
MIIITRLNVYERIFWSTVPFLIYLLKVSPEGLSSLAMSASLLSSTVAASTEKLNAKTSVATSDMVLQALPASLTRKSKHIVLIEMLKLCFGCSLFQKDAQGQQNDES